MQTPRWVREQQLHDFEVIIHLWRPTIDYFSERLFSQREPEEEGAPKRRGRQSPNANLLKTTVFFFLESEVQYEEPFIYCHIWLWIHL